MTDQVRDEYALWCEIRELIEITSSRKKGFSAEFPEIYFLYFSISAQHHAEFKKRLEETEPGKR